MAITIIATLHVKKGNMAAVIEALKEAVPKIKESEPGCLEYIPHTVAGRNNKNLIIFYEKYKDKEALTTHTNNLGTNLAKVLPLCEPGADIKTCSEIL